MGEQQAIHNDRHATLHPAYVRTCGTCLAMQCNFCKVRAPCIVGVDVVELNPPRDPSGITGLVLLLLLRALLRAAITCRPPPRAWLGLCFSVAWRTDATFRHVTRPAGRPGNSNHVAAKIVHEALAVMVHHPLTR